MKGRWAVDERWGSSFLGEPEEMLLGLCHFSPRRLRPGGKAEQVSAILPPDTRQAPCSLKALPA